MHKLLKLYISDLKLRNYSERTIKSYRNANLRFISYLETEGIIISKGTLGRFVTEDDKQLEIGRKHLAEKIVKEFMCKLDSLAITKAEAIKLIKEVEL